MIEFILEEKIKKVFKESNNKLAFKSLLQLLLVAI